MYKDAGLLTINWVIIGFRHPSPVDLSVSITSIMILDLDLENDENNDNDARASDPILQKSPRLEGAVFPLRESLKKAPLYLVDAMTSAKVSLRPPATDAEPPRSPW